MFTNIESPLNGQIDVKHPWLVVLGLGLGFLLGSYDISGMNLALVWVQQDLSLSLSSIDWMVNAYLITFASLLIPAGRLSDLYGPKRFFLLGLFLIMMGSLLASISHTGWQLIGTRALQGIGSASCVPGIQSITLQMFDKKKAGAPLGLLIGLGGIGMALGPLLSGYILSSYSWRFILLLNLPIAIVSFSLIYFFLPSKAFVKKEGTIDFPGLILLLLFSVSFIFAIDQLGKLGFMHKKLYGWLAASLGLLWLFVVREDNAENPLIDIHTLNSGPFIMGVIFRLTTTFAFYSILFLSGYALLQIAIIEPKSAGLFFLPLTLPFAVCCFLGGVLSKRFAPKNIMYLSLWIIGIGLLELAYCAGVLGAHELFVFPFVFLGIGFGLFLANNILFSIQPLPSSHLGIGVGILYTANLLASSIAVIVASYLMQSPGFNLVIQLLRSEKIQLSDMKISLIHSVMNGMSSIPDTLMHFSDHAKIVYQAIRAGFLSIMSLDLLIASGLVLVPMWIYQIVGKFQRKKISEL